MTKNCFEERELWGVALANNFGKLVSELILGEILVALGSSYAELLSITTLGSSFGEQLCGAALGRRNNFARQLRTEALKTRELIQQIIPKSEQKAFLKKLSSPLGAGAVRKKIEEYDLSRPY